VALLRETQLSGMPPTWVFTAGFDPFRDEGRAYASRLRTAGSVAFHHTDQGLLHGFANFVGADREARAAMRNIAETLKDALGVTAATGARSGRPAFSATSGALAS
jgi:acetyl esterase